MNWLRVTLGVTLVLLTSTSVLSQSSEGVSSQIVDATREGDAGELAGYFNSNIELVLPEKSGIFSKSQAEMVLKDFFAQYPPNGFEIIHEGNRQSASYAIGSYTTSKTTFRIYFLTKNTDNKLLIHQLRIEKQDD